jgi:hypothetical protein
MGVQRENNEITLGQLMVIFGFFLTLAAILRFVFVALTTMPTADPWRHMLLVKNIRDGVGFSLFDGQPYIWYTPIWYYLCAAVTTPEGIKWISATFSTLAVPVFVFYLYKRESADWRAAIVGGLLMALFGPMIHFTCQLGAEAFAVFLLVLALAISVFGRGWISGLTSGVFLGLSLLARFQFAFDALLFLPMFRRRWRGAAFLAGAALPIGIEWWRHHAVISRYPFVFTWDGIATRSQDYNFISTLVTQLHPTVGEALRMLHQRILPMPQWLYSHDRLRWEILLFLAVGVGCVLATKRISLILPALTTIIYFVLFDHTLSSRFFRIWLGLFPVLFVGIAETASRFAGGRPSYRWPLFFIVALAISFTGIVELKPKEMMPIEVATPPAELLADSHYMVNSGFYHPEILAYRFPDKRFIGMPLHPEIFKEFRQHFPEYSAVIWHGFNLQTDLFEYLQRSGEYSLTGRGTSVSGYPYLIVRLNDDFSSSSPKK